MKPGDAGGATSGLEIVQDARFQTRDRVVQRIGWAIMLLLALAALIGVFGRGAVSRAVAESSNGRMVVHFDRIVRSTAQTNLTIELPLSTGEVGIWLDRRLIDDFSLQDIVPTPSRTTTTQNHFTYYFQTTPHATVVFPLEPQKIGWRRVAIGLADQSTVLNLRYLILP
jgi:hypothetical protein